MIDPREVRAGNWVLKITGTDRNAQSFFEYRSIQPDEYYYTFANVCFPITITTSILGKSGFTHEFGDWYINRSVDGIQGGLPFLSYHHADRCWYLEKIKLWSQPLYVHQLQNLFYALCNEELPVKLGDFQNMALLEPIGFFVKADERKLLEKKCPLNS